MLAAFARLALPLTGQGVVVPWAYNLQYLISPRQFSEVGGKSVVISVLLIRIQDHARKRLSWDQS